MALSDAAIRAAKAGSSQFKLFDEGGLFLIVRPSGIFGESKTDVR